MPKKYTMVDSSGQRHSNVYDEDLFEFMEMFPGAYILETIDEEDPATQEEAEKQLELMNQPTDYESTLESELSKYDNDNNNLKTVYDVAFDSAQQRDEFTKSLSPEEQEHIKNKEFDKLSSKTKASLNLTPIKNALPDGGAPDIKGAVKQLGLSTRRLQKVAGTEQDEYTGSKDSYRNDLNSYLENRDTSTIPTDFLDTKMGSAVIGNEEEKVVPTMSKLYKPYGFIFEETGAGDAMIVRTRDGNKEIEIDLDNWTNAGDREQALKLKNFLDANQGTFSPITDERKYIDDLAYNTYQNLDKAAKIEQGDWALTKVDRDIDDETITLWDNDYREDIVKNQTASLNNQVINLNKNSALLEAQQNTLAYNQNKLQEDIAAGLPQDQIDIRVKELKDEAVRLQENAATYKDVYEKEILPLQGALNVIQGKNYVIQAEKGDIGSHTLNIFGDIVDSFANVGTAVALSIEELELEAQGIDSTIIQEKMDERLKGFDGEIKFTDTSNEYAQEFDNSILGGVYRAGVEMIGMMGAAALTGPAAPLTYGSLMGVNIAGNVVDEMNEMEGVSNKEKLMLASVIGVANGALEAVGAKYTKVFQPLTNGKTLTGGVQKLILNAFGKVPKGSLTKAALQKATIEAVEEGLKTNALKVARNGLIEGFLGEGITEVTQTFAETGFKSLYNQLKGEEKFEKLAEQITLNNLAKTFTIGGITGGLFGGLSGARDAYRTKTVDKLSNKQFLFVKALMKDKKLHSFYSAKLQTEINNPKSKFTKEKAEKELAQLRAMGGLYNQVSNLGLTTEGEKRAFTLLQRKQGLQKQLDSLTDKALGKRQREEITAIDKQLEDISLTYNFETQYQRGLQKAKDIAEASGKGFQIIEDPDEYAAKMQELGQQDQNEDGFRSEPGYIHTDGNIYINDAVARDLKQIGVGQHELLHGITGKQLQGITGEAKAKLIEDFKKNLSKKELAAIMPRINDEYGGAKGITAEEFFNVFTEAIVEGEITYNENFGTKIRDWITTNILRPLGFSQANFKDGKAVYRFMKDYGQQGRRIALGLQEDYEGDVGRIVSEGTAAPAIPMQSRVASNAAATDLATQYKDGTITNEGTIDFIQQYHNLGKAAMGFDQAKGDITEAEAISFLNKEFPSIMRNYDPSRELQFSTYLNNTIPFRAVDFYEQQIGDKAKTTSTDSDTARQLVADDTSPVDTRTDREIRQAERKGVKVREKLDTKPTISREGKVVRTAGPATSTTSIYKVDRLYNFIRSKAKKQNMRGKTLKQLKGFALREVVDMIARDNKDLADSMFKKIEKNSDLNKAEMLAIQNFIFADPDLAKGSLIEGYTSEFKATGVVNKLLEKFYNKRSVRAQTGAGLNVQIKKPNISDTEFKEAFGIIGRDRANWNQKVPASKGGVSDILKGFVRNLDQIISSQEIREQYIADGDKTEALNTLSDGVPSGFFSRKKKFSTENLGKTFSKLNEDQKEIYLANVPQFIELITAGYSVDAAFETAFPNDFLTKKVKGRIEDNLTRKTIKNDWNNIVDQFPKTLFKSKKFNKTKLNEYLHTALAEQTSRELVRDILGINKDGLDWRSPKQITSYVSSRKEYFGDLRKDFDSDLEFFQYVITHFETTFTGAAKIGGLPHHVWTKDGKLVEGKKTKRSTDIRAGIFNNRTEFYNVLLKSFDTENKLKPARGGFTYDGNLIEINRAPQSNNATKKYLNEFLKTGKLSNKTLKTSYNDAIGNQNAIIRLLKWYKTKEKDPNSDVDTNDIGMFFVNSTGDMTAILRSAYFMDSIALSDSKNPKDYRFEHNPPVRVMQIYMAQFVNGTINEAQLKEKFADTSVSVIPILMDDAINIRYKDTIPLDYTGRFDRFYNPTTYGKFPFEMTVYTPVFDSEGEVTSFKKEIKGKELKQAYQEEQAALKADKELGFASRVTRTNNVTIKELLDQFKSMDQALINGNKIDQPVRKIRVFDFDDTLATSKNLVFATRGDERIELNAEEFAKDGERLLSEGYKFDFTDFNTVRDGGRGPLFELAKRIKAARGNEDLYVLTARAPEAQTAIYEFLKSQGLEFKKQNIVGLGDSTGAAKAQWMISKYAEGYNDFYFADDAYQNVYAVKKAFEVLDVKGRVQQAKADQGFRSVRNVNKEFNDIIEQTKGIDSDTTFSDVRAKLSGQKNDKFKFWIPYSAEDFLGLIYPLLGKGKQGNEQLKWFKEMLLDPLARANEAISASRLQLMEDFKALKEVLNVPKNINKENETGFTTEQTIRMYIWNSLGVDVPGVTKTELNKAIKYVESQENLKTFAEQLLNVTKGDGWSKPSKNWFAGTIQTDLLDVLNTTKRAKFMQEFKDNADIIFSKENLNKLEAIFGTKYREALENMLKRIDTGKNRLNGGNRLSDRVLNYINGSIGAIMFLNVRSAVLQLISNINFINWSDNNPLAAGKAFANQPQYWRDFKTLMNSDFLRDRRAGLRLNINENEIADLARTAKNKGKAAISYLLRKGYLPTQFADSFAIASGGATFYRNRINTYLKDGLSQTEAEQKAMQDFRELAEESQQSSRPDKISEQQASDLGRLLLAFANTPMQYGRLTKRAYQDLINGRGDAKSNVSRIIYYTFVQNMIFNALQQAVFALGFGDEEDDEKKQDKYLDTANGMADSILRGLGIAGQAVSVGKNFLLDIYERSGRSRPEYVDSVYKLLQFSPPISSKISKIRQAAWRFDSKKRRQEMIDKGFSLDNPAYEAFAKVITATTNIPLDRLYLKLDNIEAALAEDSETWQTIALLAGWPEWQIKPTKRSNSSSGKGGYKSAFSKYKKKTRKKKKKQGAKF